MDGVTYRCAVFFAIILHLIKSHRPCPAAKKRKRPAAETGRILEMFFEWLFTRLVKTGSLTVIDHDGRRNRFQGTRPGPAVTIRLDDPAFRRHFPLDPELALGEAYMNGTLTIENGSLYDLLSLLARNLEETRPHLAIRFIHWLNGLFRRFQQFNPISRARRNAAYHYDLSAKLYDLFLDRDRQYSCAYFTDGNETLEEAQEKKKRHIAAKLLIKPGQTVLDIGCGWGGLGFYLAREAGAKVTGLTLSNEQLREARARAEKESPGGRVQFYLRDYREETGIYDRIVSVGMFEHVGINHFRRFFEQLGVLMAPGGVALLHTIGRTNGPGATSHWIRKYIFPGGCLPALSEILPYVEKAGLVVTDIETLRLHYAETLRRWRQRFQANREKAKAIYDERFCRMWEYYLAGSEISFRHLGLVVFQIQMAHRQEAVPLTRDYITDFGRKAGKGHSGQRVA